MQLPCPLCNEDVFLAAKEGLIEFSYWFVEGGIVEEGVTEVFMKVSTLLIVPIVHGAEIGFRRAGGQASGVRARAKGCFLNN